MNIEEYLKIENNLQNIDDEIIFNDIPIWRIIRLGFRWRYLNYKAKTINKEISPIHQLYNFFKSFISFINLLINRPHYDNLIFPHPRLYMVNNYFMDRLTDPLIDFSNIRKSYLILERHQNGIHKKPRLHSNKVIYLDFITDLSLILKVLIYPYIKLKYKKSVNNIFYKLAEAYNIDQSYCKMFYSYLSSFYISYCFISPILSALSPKRVFVVPNATFNYVTARCKKKGIKVYEIQHGITIGKTVLYSGKYCPALDPDYFLVFGKSSVSENFGIPLDKVINIGFAYKDYVKHIMHEQYDDNTILVLSEPDISTKIVDTLLLLTESNPNYIFHIRCHPQETISKQDIEKLKDKPIQVIDNREESFIAISKYKNVLGENSSSVFEAISLGKKVARLNFNGFHSIIDGVYNIGMLINCVDDFTDFMANTLIDENNVNRINNIYSDFNSDIVNCLD